MGRRPLTRPILVQPADSSYRLIALTQGQVAKVDTADYDWLMQWNWCAQLNLGKWYAFRRDGSRMLKMHQAICGTQESRDIDHKDHDTLNNRRFNLRPCPHSKNMLNRKIHHNNKSGFKGVCPSGNKWIALVQVNGSQEYLGSFDSPQLAHDAYLHRAKELHNDFFCPG